MMYQNYNMTKLHHITTKRQDIMTIDHIRKLWLSINSVALMNPWLPVRKPHIFSALHKKHPFLSS